MKGLNSWMFGKESSLEELCYSFILCRDLGFKLEYDSPAEQADHIGRMLNGLIRSVRGLA